MNILQIVLSIIAIVYFGYGLISFFKDFSSSNPYTSKPEESGLVYHFAMFFFVIICSGCIDLFGFFEKRRIKAERPDK